MQPVDQALRKIRAFHFAALLIQLGLLGLAAWLSWILMNAIAGKYLLSHPAIGFLLASTAILFYASKSVALFLSRTDSQVARDLDLRFHLKDRVTTYVELRRTEHPFRDALTADLQERMQSISIFKASDIGRGMISPFVLSITLLGAMALLPILPVPQSVMARKQQQTEIKREARRLERVLNKLLAEQRKDPELRKLLQELRKAAQDLEKNPAGKAEALKKLNTLQEQLARRTAKLEESNKEKLAKAWKELAGKRPADGLPGVDKQEWQKLAKEIERTLGSQEGKGGQEGPAGKGLNHEDLQKLKKAMSDYESQKEQSEKSMAEMQNALKNARTGLTSGKHKITADSKISDRDIEKGKGGTEDGPGTTNKDLGPQHFDTKKQNQGEYVEDRTKAEYEKLYDGQRENAGKDPFFVNSQWNENGNPTFNRIRSFGLDSDPKLQGPADQQIAQNNEESEVRKERIPPSYQKIVKKYFESIQE